MKRNRRWLLIFTAVVGLMAHTGALRPPSLHFNKAAAKTSTTVSTTKSTLSSTTEAAEEVQSTEESAPNKTETTKSTLTGIPQIDYIWDPNLPRELNGYNLSEYPFLVTIPERREIEFKCDGLHDGFYASIKHKCQIYHHCIYGVRHDFLCANYTAFDQKTFICHFVSEVDCKNSDKYWFRNDALYKATTTTTTSTTTTTPAPTPPGDVKRPFRRPHRRRRPVDYYYDEEYDDDYYEERVKVRQKARPRPRRPDFEDYEDEIYEKRPYNRERNRGGDADDLSYNRRPAERTKDRPNDERRPNDRPIGERRPNDRPIGERRPNDRPVDERRPIDRPVDERRPIDRPVDERRPIDRPVDERRPIDRPIDERRPNDRPIEDRRPIDRPPVERPIDRLRNRNRPEDSRRFNDEDRLPAPRKPGKRRRPIDDYEDEDLGTDGGRRFNSNDRRQHFTKSGEENTKYVDEEDDRRPLVGRRRKVNRRPIVDDEEDELDDRPLRRDPQPIDEPATKDRNVDKVETVPVVRSSGSGSLFERPRVPPRIALPVPVNERKKYEYATTKKTTTVAPRYDDEYYDDYEDIKPAKKSQQEYKYAASGRDRDRDPEPRHPLDVRNPLAVKEDPKTRYETVGASTGTGGYEDTSVKYLRQRPTSERNNLKPTSSRAETFPRDIVGKEELHPISQQNTQNHNKNVYKTPAHEPYYKNTESRESEYLKPESRESGYKSESKDTRYKTEHILDNEYKLDDRDISNSRDVVRPVVRVIKRPFLPSRGGSPYLPRGLQPVGAALNPLPTESTPIDMGSTVSGIRLLEHGPPILRANSDHDEYPPPRQGPRTTQQPQIDQERAALEKLYESEYDVTLNDALNPTLKPIARGLPSIFTHPGTFSNRFSSINSSPYTYQDSLLSSTDSRRTAIHPPAEIARTSQSRHEQAYYDYDY